MPTSHRDHRRLSPAEIFGLTPLKTTLRQAKLVFLGDPSLPKSKFGLSSLDLTTPKLSIQTWLGRRVLGRTIPILNLVNRTQTPPESGWSVKVTQVRDFRGKRLTYDSHNGTDFVIPPGTVVTACAPARVVSIRREFNRGGLKIYLDHGDGLVTTANHLGRALVNVGDVVTRGQPIALSAYSGADGFLTFPWVAPHVHFNVIQNGVLVDPFAADGEISLWNNGNAPLTTAHLDPEETFAPTTHAKESVDALLDDLDNHERRAHFSKIDDDTLRGFDLIVEATTYPTRFRTRDAAARLYSTPHPRAPRLDLPFRRDDFDGIAFIDDERIARV